MKFFKSFEFIALIATLMGISAFGIDAILPAFPAFAQDFALHGERANDVQLVVYVFMFGFSIMQLFFGVLADFFGRKYLLLCGLTVYVMASVSVLFIDSFQALLWARFWQGVGLAAPRVLTQAVVRDAVSGREMSRIMSFSMIVFLLVPILAPSIGQLTLSLGNWHSVFYLFVLVGILTFLWVALRLPESLPIEKRNPPNMQRLMAALKTCFTHRQTLVYMLILSAMFSMMMIYIGQAEQIYGSAVYGLGEKFALAFAVTALGMVAASVVNAQIVMRLGMHRIAFWALLAMVIGDGFLLVNALLFGGKPPLWIFIPLLMFHMFCFSLTMPNLNSLILEPHGGIAGTISAMVGTIMSVIGLAVAHLVSGQFNGTVFPLAIAWFVLSLLANLGNYYVNRLMRYMY